MTVQLYAVGEEESSVSWPKTYQREVTGVYMIGQPQKPDETAPEIPRQILPLVPANPTPEQQISVELMKKMLEIFDERGERIKELEQRVAELEQSGKGGWADAAHKLYCELHAVDERILTVGIGKGPVLVVYVISSRCKKPLSIPDKFMDRPVVVKKVSMPRPIKASE